MFFRAGCNSQTKCGADSAESIENTPLFLFIRFSERSDAFDASHFTGTLVFSRSLPTIFRLNKIPVHPKFQRPAVIDSRLFCVEPCGGGSRSTRGWVHAGIRRRFGLRQCPFRRSERGAKDGRTNPFAASSSGSPDVRLTPIIESEWPAVAPVR